MGKLLPEHIQLQIHKEARAIYDSYHGRVEKYYNLYLDSETRRKEAMELLQPIIEWGHSLTDIPLGASISEEVLRRAKAYTEANKTDHHSVDEKLNRQPRTIGTLVFDPFDSSPTGFRAHAIYFAEWVAKYCVWSEPCQRWMIFISEICDEHEVAEHIGEVYTIYCNHKNEKK